MGELIAVLSGKGGTGKTTVCAGIASALAFAGHRVLCIDCDVGLQNLDIALGLDQMGTLSFQDLCSGGYTFEQVISHPDCGNLFFLTSPLNCAATDIPEDAFRNMLQQAREWYDYIFLDAPAGIEAGLQLSARYADRILLVTGPDPAAIRDATRAGELLDRMGKHNVRLVVNRVSKRMRSVLRITVDDIMDTAGLPLLGIVPEDVHVLQAAAAQKLLLKYTKRGAAAACGRIAKRLLGKYQPIFL